MIAVSEKVVHADGSATVVTNVTSNEATAGTPVTRMALHTKARSKHPDYPERSGVTDGQVPWDSDFGDYKAIEFTHPVVFTNDCTVKEGGWADPADITKIEWGKRTSYEAALKFSSEGLPLNPGGRTGMSGRGLLGKWGPNFAADPVMTRVKPGVDKQYQFVSIRRKDTGEWAIPGGMVDAGEHMSVTARREFMEETQNLPAEDRASFNDELEQLFKSGVKVFEGYVDDPRSTDNAWIETSVFHYHCPPNIAEVIKFEAGDDAQNVKWMDIDIKEGSEFMMMYANHKFFVQQAISSL